MISHCISSWWSVTAPHSSPPLSILTSSVSSFTVWCAPLSRLSQLYTTPLLRRTSHSYHTSLDHWYILGWFTLLEMDRCHIHAWSNIFHVFGCDSSPRSPNVCVCVCVCVSVTLATTVLKLKTLKFLVLKDFWMTSEGLLKDFWRTFDFMVYKIY